MMIEEFKECLNCHYKYPEDEFYDPVTTDKDTDICWFCLYWIYEDKNQ